MSDSAPTQNPTRNGACLCGNIHFKITGDPFLPLVCHCNNCKKASGSSYEANLLFKEDQVKIVDEQGFLRTFVDSDTGSGNPVHRQFCGNCGSSLFRIRADGGTRAVCSGVVEDITGWGPTKEFYCKDRREWQPEISGTEHFARMPELAD